MNKLKFLTKCPICDSENNSPFFVIENFPYFTAPVKKEDKKAIIKKYNGRLNDRLESFLCGECNHIFLEEKIKTQKIISELYKKYYSYPSALEGGFLPTRDNGFLKIFNKDMQKNIKTNQKKILEIGCYDGYILYQLKKQGFNVTGCDPSAGALIGKRHGINIKKRFFDVNDFLKEKLKYDVVIFRHFLEHVANPVNFLTKIKKLLNNQGLVIFEVPNIEFQLKNGNTSIFSFQHLQYFSKNSIYELLKKANLVPIRLIKSEGDLIVVCSCLGKFKKYDKKASTGFYRTFKNKLKKKDSQLKKILKDYEKKDLVLWGAGGACIDFLERYPNSKNRLRLIVDSDAKKWGMEFLKYDTPIASPEKLSEIKHNFLIISSMYANEIINNLKKTKYDKPIIGLFPNLKIYKPNKNA